MVRVLHVAQPVDGGVAQYVVDMVRRQVAAGLDVHVACPAPSDLAEAVGLAGGRVHPWPTRRSIGPWVALETVLLARLVHRVEPSVVHLHSAKAGLSGRLAVRGRVWTVYQPHGWSYDATDGVVRRLAVAWERAALAWSHAVLCVSQGERDSGLDHGLALGERCTVVPNGVDLTRFRPRDRAQARRELALAGGPVAVCVGRLSQQKGQGVAVDAWPLVRERVPGARLVLVGSGPCSAELEAAAGPGVVLAGPVGDAAPWYTAADVVVLPSRWGEGMPLVLLEAMASGRSVVASDVVGTKEALPPGTTAVVPPQDPVALATALAERLQDAPAADREGGMNWAHVKERHDVELTGARVVQVYRSLLQAP